jgi:RNA polymerase sigma-70 factor, ECF subfamily
MLENQTSLTLLERVRRQDQVAWQRLLYLYAPLVQSWCRRWDVQGADAEDIQQEVFLAVSRGLDTFRRDRAGDTFRGWLWVIAQRKYLDYYRSRKRRAGIEGTGDVEQLSQIPFIEQAEPDDPPDEVTRLHHRALELVRVEFEEKTWQVFWRTSVDGATPADVAKEMEMTPAAVRKAKSRVLHRLKEELGELLR